MQEKVREERRGENNAGDDGREENEHIRQ